MQNPREISTKGKSGGRNQSKGGLSRKKQIGFGRGNCEEKEALDQKKVLVTIDLVL